MSGMGAMLDHEKAIGILNDALGAKFHSLASYILESSPYARPSDLPLVEAIERIAAADREQAREIACVIENLDGIAIAGAPDPFVSEIAYLAIGRLAERCLESKQAEAQKSEARLRAFSEQYPEAGSGMAAAKILLKQIAEADADHAALLAGVLASAKPVADESPADGPGESSESV